VRRSYSREDAFHHVLHKLRHGIEDQDRFLPPMRKPECASRKTQIEAPPSYRNKLSRPMDQRKSPESAPGFARYFEMDVTLVRIIFILLAFWPPSIGLIGTSSRG